jgi:hypothetical protein
MKTFVREEAFNLSALDSKGNVLAVHKPKNLSDARALVADQVKLQDETVKPHQYLLQQGRQQLRIFDKDGKEFPVAGKLEVVHTYMQGDSLFSGHYAASDLKDAKNTVDKLAKSPEDDKRSKGFSIVDADTKIPLFKYDAAGKELDLAPDGRREQVWVKLDLSPRSPRGLRNQVAPYLHTYFPNYGFDLVKELDKLPLSAHQAMPKKPDLFNSIARGNLQAVYLDAPDKSRELVYVAADPQFKKLKMLDKDFRTIQQAPATEHVKEPTIERV